MNPWRKNSSDANQLVGKTWWLLLLPFVPREAIFPFRSTSTRPSEAASRLKIWEVFLSTITSTRIYKRRSRSRRGTQVAFLALGSVSFCCGWEVANIFFPPPYIRVWNVTKNKWTSIKSRRVITISIPRLKKKGNNNYFAHISKVNWRTMLSCERGILRNWVHAESAQSAWSIES